MSSALNSDFDSSISNDEFYINKCFELAKNAIGMVSPNPLVGALIVKNNKVISQGYHKKSGCAHAELDAINNAKESAKESIEGATLYCNLEPCCHTNKKTAPCAQRIIKEKVKRVVISNLDPNPHVSGKGVELLRDAGIEVTINILKSAGERLNEIFFHHIRNKAPFVHLKSAQTLDGKAATKSGESKWITTDTARKHVHEQRNYYDGILIGAETARRDNPKLTVRLDNSEKPIKRFVLSQTGNLSSQLKLFTDEYKEHTYLVLPIGLKSAINTNIIYVKANSSGAIILQDFLKKIYKENMITSLYVEGGSEIHSQFIREKLFNRLSIYTAVKILGEGKNTFQDIGIGSMSNALTLNNIEFTQLDKDFLITGTKG